ncbi:phage tail assembly chaperone [Martelella alba]|uniref:Phage tail assembly chaperone n=1 Tax=Martelella alba TaxID=2590451 RepID=A0A506U900_9HYPH|nr:phage tail assembly chaperone [Martelella alba]
MIADHIRTLFQIAIGSEKIGWTPATFWAATPAELVMAIDGVTGKASSPSPVSRDRIRAIVAGHGPQKSIRKGKAP